MNNIKKQIILNFNEIILDLLKQTLDILGNSYLFYYQKMIKIDSLKPINTFINYGLPYKELVVSRDPTYFYDEKNISNNIEDDDEKDYYFTEIIKLKSIYINVDDTSKKNLWNILDALILLSEKFINN